MKKKEECNMYTVTTESSFDAAHFLADYNGKCRNLHGHRWRVQIEIAGEELKEDGMVVDFTEVKNALREMTEYLDHCLIIEKNSLKPLTYQALQEEDFRIVEVPFRPTAEHFSRYFFEQMEQRGYQVYRAVVYETPNNCAAYGR